MGNLSAFLAQNVKRAQVVSALVSPRFTDENGKPVPFQIQPVSSAEDDIIREGCRRIVKLGGKNSAEIDYSLYLKRLAARCVVFPDLNSTELQDSYGVIGAEELITAMLLPGEYTFLIEKVQEANGFDRSFEELVGDVKN